VIRRDSDRASPCRQGGGRRRSARFALANPVADAVLYEGYLVYPYRSSSTKNQIRWQFGVLMPPAFVAAGSGERDTMFVDFLAEPGPTAALHVRVRFLQLRLARSFAFRPGGFADGARRGGDPIVQSVIFDVDGDIHLAVTLEDDPGAELELLQGRFRYFAPEEIEPL
jgi:hypothetical protein